MLAAVYFNNQLCFQTYEVNDIWTNWKLPTKPAPGELVTTQVSPQAALGVRHLATELSCKKLLGAIAHRNSLPPDSPDPPNRPHPPFGHLPPRAGEGTAWVCEFAKRRYAIFAASVLPRSAGDFTVVTPAFSSAANLAAAVPLPPEMIAPAWPMRLPAGALAPAMNATTGLVTYSEMNSAASSSALPPISPTMMMPFVCGSSWKRRRQSMKFRPLIGSPPMPMQVLWPRPACVVWNTAS